MSAAFNEFSRHDQQVVAAGDRLAVTAFFLEHTHKQAPQVVGEKQQAGGRFADHAFAAAKAAEAPLVFEFIKNVLRVAAFENREYDLSGRG